MRFVKYLTVALLIGLASCASIIHEAPVVENFIFTPPATLPPSKSNLTVAILIPSQAGSLFGGRADLQPIYADFFNAAQRDLEKVINAKGFKTTGSYPTFDDMTFSQKERSSLILLPEIHIDVALSGGSTGVATVSGAVALQFLEPMSKEKVWIKRFELPPTTQNVQLAVLIHSNGEPVIGANGQPVGGLTVNGTRQLLNAFYQSAFNEIWAQLDPQDLAAQKADTDRLKAKTNYRAN